MQHRPQQADGNRFNLERAELVSDRDNGLVVERMPDLAGRQNSLRNLERQRARDIGLGIGHLMIKWLKSAAFAKDKDVGMAFGDQQRRLGRALGHDRVDCMRGAVNESAATT